jgi:hypothetical protein
MVDDRVLGGARRRWRRLGVVLVAVAVLMLAWLLTKPFGDPDDHCRDTEPISTAEVQRDLGVPVDGSQRASGRCQFALGGDAAGALLRIHLPRYYFPRDADGLRRLDLAAIAAGADAVTLPDGSGRASYESTPRGESLVVSAGAMQAVLVLRTESEGGRPPVPDGARAGLVALARRVVSEFSAELAPEFPPPIRASADERSTTRELCAPLLTLTEVEHSMQMLVTEVEQYGEFPACRFALDEPTAASVSIGTQRGPATPADVAGLRALDLAAIPTFDGGPVAPSVEEAPSAFVVDRVSGRLRVRYGSAEVYVTFTSGRIPAPRAAMIALAAVVIARL